MKRSFCLLLFCLSGYFATAQCWEKVAIGTYHAIALKSDGTLWSWGWNGVGQLGDGTTTDRRFPKQIGTDTDWKAVFAAYGLSFGIKNNGTLWAWGVNDWGQLGIGSFGGYRSIPTKIGNASDWKYAFPGTTFSFAIKNDGSLWAWGNNVLGQSGTGSSATGFASPIQVGVAKDWEMVAAGGNHVLGIRTGGTLWAWGDNEYGQLGDGTDTDRTTPTRIGTETDWKTISSGYYHSLAVKTNGTLWSWGYNDKGQIGDDTFTNKSSPTLIGSDVNWKSVSTGMDNSLAIKTDGTLWAWGRIIGLISLSGENTLKVPTQLGTDADWVWSTSAPSNSFAFKTDGSLWGWGNSNELLADGTYPYEYNVLPKLITIQPPTGDALQGFCSNATVGDLKATGTAVKWYATASGGSPLSASTTLINGNHYYGTQTSGSCESSRRLDVSVVLNLVPTPAPTGQPNQTFCGSTRVADLSVTGSNIKWYSLPVGGTALPGDQTLVNGLYYATQTINYCESQERLAVAFTLKLTPPPTDIPSPLIVCNKYIGGLWSNVNWYYTATGGEKIPAETLAVNGGTYFVSAIGGCGESVARSEVVVIVKTTPAPVSLINETWKSIGAAAGSSIAVRSDGTLWVWGDEYINVDFPTPQYSPKQGGTDNSWVAVSNGGDKKMAIQSDGEIFEWNINTAAMVKVGNQNDWRSISTSGQGPAYHSSAIKSDGTLWGWGENEYGQVGDGTFVTRAGPVKIGAASDWKSVAVGLYNTLAIKTDGTLWAWGDNRYGQLGDGTTIAKSSPIRIGNGSDWEFISTSGFSCLAIKKDGTLWGWGYNQNGNLGIGNAQNQSAPTKVGTSSDWRTVSSGSKHTLAIKKDGTLWSWGYPSDGSLGTDLYSIFSTSSPNPTQVGLATHWKDISAGGGHSMALTNDGVMWIWGSNERGELGLGKILAFTRYLPYPLPSKVFSCDTPFTFDGLPIQGTNIKWYSGDTYPWPITTPTDYPLGTGIHFYATQTINGLESCTRLDIIIDPGSLPGPIRNQTQQICKEGKVGDLIPSGPAINWYETASGGSPLSTTTPLVNGKEYYASGVNGCGPNVRMLRVVATFINPSAPTGQSTQTFCKAGRVVDLVALGQTIRWYTSPTGGSPLTGTTSLVSGSSYYASQLIGECESNARLMVLVMINDPAPPKGASEQTFEGGGKTIADLVAIGSDIKWYRSQQDASNKINRLPASELLSDGRTYYATQAVDGCESTLALMVTARISLVTGLEIQTFGFQIFPNPVTDILNINHDQVIDHVTVINLLGQPVLSTEVKNNQASLNFLNLDKGMYFVQIYTNGEIISRKVVKQ